MSYATASDWTLFDSLSKLVRLMSGVTSMAPLASEKHCPRLVRVPDETIAAANAATEASLGTQASIESADFDYEDVNATAPAPSGTLVYPS